MRVVPLSSPHKARAGSLGRILRCALHGLLWVVLGCAAGVRPASAEPLRLAVSDGTVSLPVYVADAKGYFDHEGVEVRLLTCTSGRACFRMLSQDEADLATAAELMMTLNSLAGSDAAIIATLSASAQQIKLVARTTEGMAMAPAAWRGKRIGTVPGTSAQYFLDSWLVFHEIDPKTVSVVALAPDRLAEALKRREVDAIAIWEPIASATAAALGAEVSVLPNPRVYTQHFSLIASRTALAHRAEALTRVLRALASAERFIAESPAEARKLLQARLPDTPAATDLREHDFRLVLEQSLIGTMDAEARWALRQGLVPAGQGRANLLPSIDSGPLRRAVPGAVNLVR